MDCVVGIAFSEVRRECGGIHQHGSFGNSDNVFLESG